jgi:import receptor subunit TOM70
MDMTFQVDEFEEFVNNFSSQMDDILHKPSKPGDIVKKHKPGDIVKKAEAERLKGNDAFKAGDYNKAIGYYNCAISMFTNDSITMDPVLYTNRALAFLKTNEYKKALDDCNSAHDLDPKSIKAIWRRISAYRGLKEFKAALVDLGKLKDFGIQSNLI